MAEKKKNDERQQAEWDECPAGTLSALSGKLQGRKRRRRFLQVASAMSLAVLGGGAVGIALLLRPNDYDFGGITCSEVARNADAFAHGEVREPLLGKMRVHIAQCPMCGPRMRDMQMPKKLEG